MSVGDGCFDSQRLNPLGTERPYALEPTAALVQARELGVVLQLLSIVIERALDLIAELRHGGLGLSDPQGLGDFDEVSFPLR